MDLIPDLHDRTRCITSEVNNIMKFGSRYLHYNSRSPEYHEVNWTKFNINQTLRGGEWWRGCLHIVS